MATAIQKGARVGGTYRNVPFSGKVIEQRSNTVTGRYGVTVVLDAPIIVSGSARDVALVEVDRDSMSDADAGNSIATLPAEV